MLTKETLDAIFDIAFMAVVSVMVMAALALFGVPVWYGLPFIALQGYRWFFDRR